MDNSFDFGGSTRIKVLHLGYRELVGTVSPHSMALASPVWKKFIFSELADSKNLGAPGGRDEGGATTVDINSGEVPDPVAGDDERMPGQDTEVRSNIKEVEDDFAISE
jgi:hypothetical protein